MINTYFILFQLDENIEQFIFSWYGIEIIIIAAAIIYQIYHTIRVSIKIKKLKHTFTDKLFIKNVYIKKDENGDIALENIVSSTNDDEKEVKVSKKNDIVKLALLDSKGFNKIILDIKYGINTYLINNYGAAVNFSIIKDIIDREIEVKDEEIQQSVSLPLYLGLSVTMVGIIFGLFSMPSLDDDGFTLAISSLINGVKIAMIGSLVGVACTTVLSSFVYKSAKRKLQKDKNDQITLLQAKLLPELLKAEDTGVSGLKASLDRFARVATRISDNVVKSAIKTEKNLILQNDLMVKVNNMDTLKVSKFNLELFDKIDKNMEALEGFSSYIFSLKQMSSHLYEFSNRTSEIEKIASNINSSLEQSNLLYKFLTTHIQKIENSGDSALKAVGIAENHFEKAILDLDKRTKVMLDNLYKSSGDHEAKLEKIYEVIQENLNDIATKYIESLDRVFNKANPNLDKLENLSYLNEINNSVSKMPNLDDLLIKLSSIDKKLDKQNSNDLILKELNTITNQIKINTKEINNTKEQEHQVKIKKPKVSSPKKEKLSLKKVFKKLF